MIGSAEQTHEWCVKKAPGKLDEREMFYERQERYARKKNVVGKGIKEEIERVVRSKLGMLVYVDKIRPSGDGMLLRLESWQNNMELMKKRRILKDIGLRIDDDYTDR